MSYQLTVRDRYQNQIILNAKQGETLFCALGRYHSPLFYGNCGGRGSCQSCMLFLEEEQAYVRACQVKVDRNLHIRLPFSLEEEEPRLLTPEMALYSGTDSGGEALGAAVDLGTTSIGMRLLNKHTGTALCEYSLYNPQAVYGADVISRISYAKTKNGSALLKEAVWRQIFRGIRRMQECIGNRGPITDICLAGNTTMVHLLMGYDTSGLGGYPFHSGHLEAISGKIGELLQDLPDISEESRAFSDSILHIYPGISPFVGADIVSGAAALNLGQQETYDLLIDFGTNGELLLINANQGFCGAAACGSAFDGYVTRNVKASPDRGGAVYGTDIINRIMLLKNRGLIDSNGTFMNRFREKGYGFPDGTVIMQEDIRNVQKAKAAIRTGLTLLLAEAGVAFEECRIFLAGNFGFHLNPESGVSAGIFPSADNIQIAGNASLLGAERLLFKEKEALSAAEQVVKRTRALEFANMDSFSKTYIENLNF